jgi:outer membrane protein assembly factor BamB
MTPLGCASPEGTEHAGMSSTSTTTGQRRNQAARPAADQLLEDVERRYVVGPAAARELGYRIDWQFPDAGRNPQIVGAQHDSIFVLGEGNFLTRIDRERGERIWRVPAADTVTEILGVNYVPEAERVYVTAGGRVFVFDSVNGLQVGTQRLDRIANTPPIAIGQFLIYGGRAGQIVWHSHAVAYEWQAYQVSPSINIAPVEHSGYIVTVGNDGRVTVHQARTGSMAWSKRLLSPVMASPAVGEGTVFVAGLDQHIWAYDLVTGRHIWRYLTESHLTEPPVLADGRLYQQIPTEGLVCFQARPDNAPGATVIWKAPRVQGNVLAARDNRLLVWEPQSKTMTVLDAARGTVVEHRSLPQVRLLVPSGVGGDELIAVSDDGRVTRLLPRSR